MTVQKEIYGSKGTLVGPLDVEKMAQALLLFVFKNSIHSTLHLNFFVTSVQKWVGVLPQYIFLLENQVNQNYSI